MAGVIDDALRRLQDAVGLLEVATGRRLHAERGHGELEAELQIMQDDRARLALELESSAARLQHLEGLAAQLDLRIDGAVEAIRDVLARDDPGQTETPEG